MKTYSPKPEHIERRWYVVDASDQVLGRIASEVAALLRGKHKPIFAPHMDTGDHVIVINADKVVVTGGKEFKKVAYRHSGYPGGITGVRYDKLLADRPVFAVEKAIRGMLPKNRLGRTMINKLHVVAGPEHRHAAQKPVPYTFGQPPVWEGLPTPAPRPLKTRHLVEEEAVEKPASKPKTTKPEAAKPAAQTSTSKKSTAKKSTATAPKKASAAKKSTAKKTTAQKTGTKKTKAKAEPEAKAETTESTEE
jgi:large subunit ribosomal protein L13